MSDKTLSAHARADYDLEIADHRDLVTKLNSLESWLDKTTDDQNAWFERLGVVLTEIGSMLRPHFKREEDSPLFQELPIMFPRFVNTLDRLMEEHERLAQSVEDIIMDLSRLRNPTEMHAREVLCKTQLIIATLRRHESEENEILQTAYCEDIGNCD